MTKMKKTAPRPFWNSRMATQTRSCHTGAAERPSMRPSTGALSAWVKGTPNRAGPMSATVSISVARLAP